MKYSRFKKGLKNEYNDTFKEDYSLEEKKPKRVSIWIKLIPAYVFILLVFIGIGALITDYASVNSYNNNLISQYENLEQEIVGDWDIKELTTINSKKELKNYYGFFIKEYRESIIGGFVDSLIPRFEKGGMISSKDDVKFEESMTPAKPNEGNNPSSFDTNVQEVGIDESDIAKCDGKYIYYVYDTYEGVSLYIYDLNGKLVVSKSINEAYNEAYYHHYELYVYNKSVILVSNTSYYIYDFDGENLILKTSSNNLHINDSRICGDYLYIISLNINLELDDNHEYYYDGVTSANSIYYITKINLKNYSKNEIYDLASNLSMIYMNDSYLVIANRQYVYNSIYTFLSVFDNNLNPVTLIKVKGYLNDRYSMDIYMDDFRFVVTDTCESDDDKLNSISIYNLEKKERIGYLNEGIGTDYQRVKSVTFTSDTCYVCTYFTTDPLYEINISNPSNIYIVSCYKAPGYSNYLYTWTYNNNEYVLGLGYTDSRDIKISVYKKTENGTSQIGDDFIIGYKSSIYEEFQYADYSLDALDYYMFSDGKKLFIYKSENELYLGASVSDLKYAIFKIDVLNDKVTTLYKDIDIKSTTRLFLVNGVCYLPQEGSIIMFDFK